MDKYHEFFVKCDAEFGWGTNGNIGEPNQNLPTALWDEIKSVIEATKNSNLDYETRQFRDLFIRRIEAGWDKV